MRRLLSRLNGGSKIAARIPCDLPAIANVDIVTECGDGLGKRFVVLGAHDSGHENNNVTLALRRSDFLLRESAWGK
jgi:hypothetical protein